MANTGTNSSSDRQAVISITPDGTLITKALADALKAATVIEFPESLDEEGRLDFLSSSALAQITTQLPSNAEFVTALGVEINKPQFIATIVPTVVASTQFTDAVGVGVANAFGEETNLQLAYNFITNSTNLPTLGQALAAETNFITSTTLQVITDPQYIADVEQRILNATQSRAEVYEDNVIIDADNRITVTYSITQYPTGVDLPYVISANFSGTGDTSVISEFSRSNANIVYELGGTAVPGETVKVTYTIFS